MHQKPSEPPEPFHLRHIRCYDVFFSKFVLRLFRSLPVSTWQRNSAFSASETYRLEIIAWWEDMGNATGATRPTYLGKLDTDDGSPPGTPFFEQLGKSRNTRTYSIYLPESPAAGVLDTVRRNDDTAYGVQDVGYA